MAAVFCSGIAGFLLLDFDTGHFTSAAAYLSSYLRPRVLVFLSLHGQYLPFPRAPLAIADEPVIRIMSFNIWGGSRSEATANVIIQNNWPDIVAIQELTPTMADIIDQTVGKQYPFRVLNFPQTRMGMGIYSTYPLRELDPASLSNAEWQAQVVQVEIAKRSFILYNVHTHATNVYLYLKQGLPIEQTVNTSYQNRLAFAYYLLDDIKQRNKPAVVVGDFNDTGQSDVYNALTDFLADAYHSAGQGFGHTFPAYSASFQEIPPVAKFAQFVSMQTVSFLPSYYLNVFRLLRLDMILYSQEFRAISSNVSSMHGESDHLPVLATLQWAF